MTNEHTSLEKYTLTFYSKGLRKGWLLLCVRGKLETEQTVTYWPQLPLTIAALLPYSAGCSTGVLRAQDLCLELVLTPRATVTGTEPQFQLQQTRTPVAPGYIIVWHPPASCERPICTEFNPSTGQGDTPTCYLIDGGVEGQYVIYLPYCPWYVNLRVTEQYLTSWTV